MSENEEFLIKFSEVSEVFIHITHINYLNVRGSIGILHFETMNIDWEDAQFPQANLAGDPFQHPISIRVSMKVIVTS